MAGISNLGIIISELRYEKEPCSIILLKFDKNLEVSFYYTILPLNLAVCLQVKSGGESPLDAKKLA